MLTVLVPPSHQFDIDAPADSEANVPMCAPRVIFEVKSRSVNIVKYEEDHVSFISKL